MSGLISRVGINEAKMLLAFFHLAEKLKCVLRHGWTSSGRQESVAEHSWRLALSVLFSSKYLDRELDLEKALKMALLHDIAEVITGDVPYFLAREGSPEKQLKREQEKSAIAHIVQGLDEPVREELLGLWEEYEANQSYEARVVRALDKIEAQIQQNEADLTTWLECETSDATTGYINRYCDFDSFLSKLCAVVVDESNQRVSHSQHSTNEGS